MISVGSGFLNWCRLNEPSVFGAGERAARDSGGKGSWYASVRLAIMAGGGEPSPGRPRPVFEELTPPSPQAPAGRIVVEIGCARVTLPAGAAASDVAAAVSAAAAAVGVAR